MSDATPSSWTQRWRRLTQHGVERVDRVLAAENAAAGEHLVQDGTKGEQIGARVNRLAENLLGGEVAAVPTGPPRDGGGLIAATGEP